MAPGTEFARDFCVGGGPLQLGVVLVFYFFQFFSELPHCSSALCLFCHPITLLGIPGGFQNIIAFYPTFINVRIPSSNSFGLTSHGCCFNNHVKS